MDNVVHFEITVDNLSKAQDFYKKVFGWEIENVPEMSYTIVRTAEVDEKRMIKHPGAINGGMMKKSGDIRHPVITISVENLDIKAKEIEKNGGKIIKEKMKVGDMGYAAYFKDTEGNVLGLWETIRK